MKANTLVAVHESMVSCQRFRVRGRKDGNSRFTFVMESVDWTSEGGFEQTLVTDARRSAKFRDLHFMKR
jgi:hypothetical protein